MSRPRRGATLDGLLTKIAPKVRRYRREASVAERHAVEGQAQSSSPRYLCCTHGSVHCKYCQITTAGAGLARGFACFAMLLQEAGAVLLQMRSLHCTVFSKRFLDPAVPWRGS
ncbi:hypothetical protein J6590_055861 [Homalodisca vitripennis]|nr:hypothetical protein J6590_055861 [Homalodisca vitripennis]